MKAGCCVSLALPQLTFIVNNLEVIVFMVQLSGYVYWGHIRFFYCFLQFFNGIRHGAVPMQYGRFLPVLPGNKKHP